MASKVPQQMDTSTAIEYLARKGYRVTDDTVRYHVHRGRLQAPVYGRKQRSLFVFEKVELDRFLSEVVPRLKVRWRGPGLRRRRVNPYPRLRPGRGYAFSPYQGKLFDTERGSTPQWRMSTPCGCRASIAGD